jgi:predicted Zn-dependent protease
MRGTVLSFSRDDERAADAEGAALLARAGWDPQAMVDVMAMLEQKARRRPSVPAFFATHPAPADRLARLRAIVAPLGRGRQDSAAFRDVRARAKRAPPPAHRSTAMPRP